MIDNMVVDFMYEPITYDIYKEKDTIFIINNSVFKWLERGIWGGGIVDVCTI